MTINKMATITKSIIVSKFTNFKEMKNKKNKVIDVKAKPVNEKSGKIIQNLSKIPIEYTELINARCAMIGVVSGKCFEYITNESIQQQSVDHYQYILLSGLITTILSVKYGKPEIPDTFTPSIGEIELAFGRIAMLYYALFFYIGI